MSKVEQCAKLDLERIVFIGRTYEEYLDLFALSQKELKGKKILDCPAGACSFTAIGHTLGLDITACDIAYSHAVEDLHNKGLQDITHTMEHMEKAKKRFVWHYFEDVEALRKHRQRALQHCTTDMIQSKDRYVPVTLPSLPFEDGEFDLILSAHFLFSYADRLNYDFHIETITELLRVTSKEIRIFPLVDLEGHRYEHLDQLTCFLTDLGCIVEEIKVPYEFQKNANTMLKIIK